MELNEDEQVAAGCLACVVIATAMLIGVFALGFFMGKAGVGASASPEMPRTICLQLEVLGASASAPTAITATNETEKETTGND